MYVKHILPRLAWLFLLSAALCSCDRTVHVTGVRLDRQTMTLRLSETALLNATVFPSDATEKDVSWESSNPGVVEVDGNGYVTGVQVGEAKISVITLEGGFSASCTVTVRPIEVTNLTLDKYVINIRKGEKETLTATFYPPDATSPVVSWASEDEAIATVIDGTVTAVGGGTCAVYARSGSVRSADCYVNVSSPLASISLSETELTLERGQSADLTVSLEPADATDVNLVWSSDDANVARVSSDGTIEAVGCGTTAIRVKSGDIEAACQVTVQVTVRSVAIFDDFEIEATTGRRLDIRIEPEDATDKTITWASLDPSIAYVSDGILYGVSEGRTIIGYGAGDFITTREVKVLSHAMEPDAVDLGLSSRWASFNLGATKPEEFGYYYAWGETEPKAEYTADTYKWVNHSGSSSLWTSLIKYNKDILMGYNGFTDWKATLDNTDDAAWVKLDKQWHMPTINDIFELYTRCKWDFMTYNGVRGLVITGPNGNSIFLPYAGFVSGSSLGLAGRDGYYWGNQYRSDLCGDAITMWFSDGFYTPYFEYYYAIRSAGHTIRPVTSKPAGPGGEKLRKEVERTFTAHEFFSYDMENWKESGTYQITVSFQSSSARDVTVTNLFNGGKTITGKFDTSSGNITVDKEQLIRSHPSYGDFYALSYDMVKDDISENGPTLTYLAKEKQYRSAVFLPYGKDGYLGFYYVVME